MHFCIDRLCSKATLFARQGTIIRFSKCTTTQLRNDKFIVDTRTRLHRLSDRAEAVYQRPSDFRPRLGRLLPRGNPLVVTVQHQHCAMAKKRRALSQQDLNASGGQATGTEALRIIENLELEGECS